MASAAPKCCFRIPRNLVASVAVFIFLSGVSTVPIEPRRCYWCGPLADQVHRSARAPSCDETQERITTCESEYTHCAIVAITPSPIKEIQNIIHPGSNTAYIESRMCVKSYEDECYSIYCSASKMHSMICPCRDSLCNGPSTQREREAFASLIELAKNRKKRELIASPSFKSMEMKALVNTTDVFNFNNDSDGTDDMQANEPTDDYKNETNALKDDLTINTSSEHKSNEFENKESIIAVSPQATDIVQVTEETSIATKNPIKLTTVKYEEPVMVQKNVVPSAKLPPAEALQQNVTPTDKTETTTVGTTLSVNITHLGTTLEPNKTGKGNNSGRIYIHIYILIISAVLHYI